MTIKERLTIKRRVVKYLKRFKKGKTVVDIAIGINPSIENSGPDRRYQDKESLEGTPMIRRILNELKRAGFVEVVDTLGNGARLWRYVR